MALTLCATAALAMTAAYPTRADPVSAATEGTPAPYAFADDDTRVEGATVTTDAVRLDSGHTYRSTLPAAGKRYYRLELDSAANAYVSATAVPRAGARVSSSDGLRVSVQDAGGTTCSTGTAYFGPTRSPHPIAAWASRETGAGAHGCKGAGAYYVVVERRVPGASASTPGDWDLELDYVSEPALGQAGATTPPGTWNSATPEAVLGDATRRAGGAGFATASALGQGVWQDAIRPGQTLFYKVPVDWGQQLSATVEMSSSPNADGFVGTALAMSLYNPVRAHVDDADAGYNGAQTSTALEPLPPVDHANRRAVGDRTSAMRFAGWYYLAVHLGAPVADRFGDGPFGLTLRVSGTPASGPAYAGRSAPGGVFGITAADREEAAAGTSGDGGAADGSPGAPRTDATARGDSGAESDEADRGGTDQDARTMRLVAAGGIGTGSVLVLWLALWTAVARRRAHGRWAG
ncbi:hypothetical protein [Streptomyces chiangmaiensis]|uniref:Uncharacterized protein n=1 Tax=Streptomyces chiangmaiensis TaxID=766497 RepID=A0ABU7F9Q6_9ACTN|nr:hypothetical protein [Streptomyces chiangmaiensis]MED7820920.1 hypothetical protein [Streptomyces chiangmaiensis]